MSSVSVGDIVNGHTTCPRGCCLRDIYYRLRVLEIVGTLGAWCEYSKGNRIFFKFDEMELVERAESMWSECKPGS